MKKYSESEGKLEVLRGAEADVLTKHRRRLGKASLTDFSKDELAALEADMSAVRKPEEEVT
jgi:hypothetical protein